MNELESRAEAKSSMGVANETMRVLVLFGTPVILSILELYLVGEASQRGFYPGVRSLAAALFPIVVASLLYVFSRKTLNAVAEAKTAVGVSVGAVLGIAVMVTLRVVARDAGIPLAELIVSGCIAVLVFSTAAGRGERSLSYYYGVMCGLLGYVIVFGFPVLE